MGVTPRKILAIALGLAGVIYLTVPSQGQQSPKGDQRIQPANGTANGNRPTVSFSPAVPSVIGTMDLDFVFRNYDKVKAVSKELGAAMQLKKGELMKLDNQGRQEYEYMQKFQPGSEDYRKHETAATEIKAKLEATRESAQREMALRNAESMATLYKEIQMYAQWVAKQRGITHVMLSSNSPPSGSDPDSVLAAVNRPVVYADPRNDITNDVVHYLNMTYNGVGKSASKPAALRQQTPAGAGAAARPGADQ